MQTNDTAVFNRRRQAHSLDVIFNCLIIPSLGVQAFLIGLCVIAKFITAKSDTFASQVFALLAIGLLILYFWATGSSPAQRQSAEMAEGTLDAATLPPDRRAEGDGIADHTPPVLVGQAGQWGWIGDCRAAGLPGVCALLGVLAALLSPFAPFWRDIIAMAAYSTLIAGVRLRLFPSKDLTITPIYLSVILILTHTPGYLPIYFSLFVLGFWTLWELENLDETDQFGKTAHLAKFFGFFIGLILVFAFWGDRQPGQPRVVSAQIVIMLSLIFIILVTYALQELRITYSHLHNLAIQLLVALVILASLHLLWPSSRAESVREVFWEQSLHRTYWWPLLFMIYLVALYVSRGMVRALTGARNRTTTARDALPSEAAVLRNPTANGACPALNVSFSTDMICLVFCAVVATWFDSREFVVLSPDRYQFWLNTCVSFALTASLLAIDKVSRTHFLVNVVLLFNLAWVIAAFVMITHFCDHILSVNSPANFLHSMSAAEVFSWQQWEYGRQSAFLIIVVGAIVLSSTTNTDRGIPWWHGMISPRYALLIRNSVTDIDDWGKEIPLIGVTLKTVIGLWKTLRYLKTNAAPIALYDIILLAALFLGGLSATKLIYILLTQTVEVSMTLQYETSWIWVASAVAWTMISLIIYMLGRWRREALFIFAVFGFAVIPLVSGKFIDTALNAYSYKQGALLLVFGGTLLLCGVFCRRRLLANPKTRPTDRPSAVPDDQG